MTNVWWWSRWYLLNLWWRWFLLHRHSDGRMGGRLMGKRYRVGWCRWYWKVPPSYSTSSSSSPSCFFFLFSLTIFWPKKDKVGSGEGALEQKFNFCLKWSKRAQMVPKGSQMVKDNFGRFWTLLNHFGTFTSLSCYAVFGPNWTIFGTSPVMKGGPQSKKHSSLGL